MILINQSNIQNQKLIGIKRSKADIIKAIDFHGSHQSINNLEMQVHISEFNEEDHTNKNNTISREECGLPGLEMRLI